MNHDIRRVIVDSYRSLQTPDWSFVMTRLSQGLYDDVVDEIASLGAISETTDPNDDCSRCITVIRGTEAITVRLSLVGGYACVHDSDGRFLEVNDVPAGSLAGGIAQCLERHGLQVLGKTELGTKIEFGSSQVLLYEVMFSTDGLLA